MENHQSEIENILSNKNIMYLARKLSVVIKDGIQNVQVRKYSFKPKTLPLPLALGML